jgi:beta-glucosidase/6-phospho-beta-glucosidase/beta-galactosidase
MEARRFPAGFTWGCATSALLFVDRATLARHKKRSALWFAGAARANAI